MVLKVLKGRDGRMNYTVFDVETANSQRESICAIGIIRYENNQIVFEKEILINPEVEFNYFNTRIHGIKESDVINALTFPEVWADIKDYFDNTILVAHNAKSMDLCALYRRLERYSLPLVLKMLSPWLRITICFLHYQYYSTNGWQPGKSEICYNHHLI